jgi:alcohol/geraniol dehydrogenase (NADP+)
MLRNARLTSTVFLTRPHHSTMKGELRMITAYAAKKAGGPLEPFEFDPGALKADEIEIAVDYCGVCHSDLSLLDNEWGITQFPLIPGHEVTGRIIAVGENVTQRKVGQSVGLGWFSKSCKSCPQCMSGDHNLCATAEQTIVGRYGGFANKVRCGWEWATPLPEALDPSKCGPMFCGGITVFNPIVQFGVKPTDRVGVIGIGGLGHMALQFLNKWGCEVTAFSNNMAKRDEMLKLGAHKIVNSRDSGEMKKIAGSLDFILSTVNVVLDWTVLIDCLAPKGKLHFVGVVPEPIGISAMQLIMAQRSVSGSPLGSPSTTARMLDFSARHGIAPVTEEFPMSKVNDAFEHLRAGKARYRIVLKNDIG